MFRHGVTSELSRRFYQTTVTKTAADLSKSKHMHQEMKGVLGQQAAATAKKATTPASSRPSSRSSKKEMTEADKARQARYQQSIINAAVSFFTVVLGAQCVKSASERRKAEKDAKQARKEHLQMQQALRDLQNPVALRELSKKCAAVATTTTPQAEVRTSSGTSTPPLRWWWGGAAAIVPLEEDSTSNSSVEELILEVLQKDLERRIGTTGKTEEEKDKEALDDLQKEVFSELKGDELLKELQAIQVKKDDGAVVVKKKVFSI